MTNNSIQNPHAEREGKLASLIAQETLADLHGGEEKVYNGPGLIMGLVAAFVVLLVLALIGAGFLYLIGA